jgi:hypothetical protein
MIKKRAIMLGPIFDPALQNQLHHFIICILTLTKEITLLLNDYVLNMETLFLNAIAKDVFKVHGNGT